MPKFRILTPAGLSFSKGLRSILRQDPDVVLVGEVRDSETAELARVCGSADAAAEAERDCHGHSGEQRSALRTEYFLGACVKDDRRALWQHRARCRFVSRECDAGTAIQTSRWLAVRP